MQSLSQSSLELCWHRVAVRCNVNHPSTELEGVYFWTWCISVSALCSLTFHIQWHSINASVKGMSHNFRICSQLGAAQTYLSLVIALSHFRAQHIFCDRLCTKPCSERNSLKLSQYFLSDYFLSCGSKKRSFQKVEEKWEPGMCSFMTRYLGFKNLSLSAPVWDAFVTYNFIYFKCQCSNHHKRGELTCSSVTRVGVS